MKIAPSDRLVLYALEMIKQNGWEFELRYAGGYYSLIAWKPEWVTNDLYQDIPCIGGEKEDSMFKAIMHTFERLEIEL